VKILRTENSRSSNNLDGIGRFFRSLITIVILTSFVLLISLGLKELSSLTTEEFAKFSATTLAKANIKVDENKIGEVAGAFVSRISNVGVSNDSKKEESVSSTSSTTATPTETFKVGIISDIHQDLQNLEKAITLLKKDNITEIFVLGDLTNYGDLENLTKVKTSLDASKLTYYVIPGDHDLAQSVGSTNFIQLFKQTYYFTDIKGFKFLLLDNSANFTEILPADMSKFKNDVTLADFVLLSQPLYTEGLNLPFSKMYMGSVYTEVKSDLVENQKRVSAQKDLLLGWVRASNVKAIIAGDHHHSSHVVDSNRAFLAHYTVGAVSSVLNDQFPQKVVQSSRFSVLTLYNNKTYKIDDVVLD
jgi:predicted phosphodiesterase